MSNSTVSIDPRNIKQIKIKAFTKLEAKYLNSNIIYNLLESFSKKYNNKYINTHGFILDVLSVLDYSNYISNADSSIVFNGTILVNCINPSLGEYIYGKCMLTNRGIFTKINSNIFVFVSIKTLNSEGYNYNEEENILTGKDCIIGNNDNIRCKVTVSEYSDKSVKYLADNLEKDI